MYSTQDDLNLSDQRLVELTDSVEAPDVPDPALIARLGIRANSRVDGALSKIYITPIVSPPRIVVDVEATLWKYLIYTHREVMQVPDTVMKEYEWATAQLELWRSGGEPLDAPARTTFIGAMVL